MIASKMLKLLEKDKLKHMVKVRNRSCVLMLLVMSFLFNITVSAQWYFEVHSDSLVVDTINTVEDTLRVEYYFNEDGLYLQEFFYLDGTKCETHNMESGVSHGKSISWHKNGKLMAKEEYNHGMLVGVSQRWYPTGEIQTEAFYDVNGGIERVYYQNGNLKSVNSLDQRGHYLGLSHFWCVNGNIDKTEYYTRTEKHLVKYYCSGKIEIEGRYVDGFIDGEWKYWNEQGELIKQETYETGELIYEKEY
jgi:uncharacterized protein